MITTTTTPPDRLPYKIRAELELHSLHGLVQMQFPTALLLGRLRHQVEPADLRQIAGLNLAEHYELVRWAYDQRDSRTPAEIHALFDAIEDIPVEQ